jgi:predicted Holliday junction resolvase-like endonuclease
MSRLAGPILKYLIVAALAVIVLFEGYYIFMLREKISRQTEDLKDISVQLQLLKRERDVLNEEVSSARKKAGEDNNGDTVQR